MTESQDRLCWGPWLCRVSRTVVTPWLTFSILQTAADCLGGVGFFTHGIQVQFYVCYMVYILVGLIWVFLSALCLCTTCESYPRNPEGRVLDLLGQEFQLAVSWDLWKRSPLSPSLHPPCHIFNGVVTTSPPCWWPCLEMRFQLDESLQHYLLINRNLYSVVCSVTHRLLHIKPKPRLDWHVLSVPNF